MKKIAAFNWKLKPTTIEEAKKTIAFQKKWAKKYDTVDVISAPPMPFINGLVSNHAPLILAAQNSSQYSEGAHTGEASPTMLQSIGCSYVILGHSERRDEQKETNKEVSLKAQKALQEGLLPIVCFGENTRDTKGAYIDVLTKQLTESLADIPERQASKVVVAYEPVWAIGTGASISNEDLFSTIILIKKILVSMYGESRARKIKILYGGSVKDHNAKELAGVRGVSGFLVGGASHKSDQVEAIISSLA